MKRILTIIITSVFLCGCEATFTEFWSEASYATIEAITGNYTLTSGTWSSEIDLSGNGSVTNDILHQLEMYGWMGIQGIRQEDDPESVSVLERSLVITPERPEYRTQINLYVPYPEFGKEQTEMAVEKTGRCNIYISAFQFHYKVDSRGDIELFNTGGRQMTGHGGRLEDVEVRFEGEHLYFKAETSFYDWSTQSWQDGTMNLTYRHN